MARYFEPQRPDAVIGTTNARRSPRIIGIAASIGGQAALIPVGFYRPHLLMAGNLAGAATAAKQDTMYLRQLMRKGDGLAGNVNVQAVNEVRKARRADRANAVISALPAAEQIFTGSGSLISWAITIPAVLLLTRYATRKIQKARASELAGDFWNSASRAKMTIGQLEEYFGLLQTEEMRLREKGYKNRNDAGENRLNELAGLLSRINDELHMRYAADAKKKAQS